MNVCGRAAFSRCTQMHIPLSLSTLCAIAVAAVWSAHPSASDVDAGRTVPSADGSFVLDNVPAGKYRLGAWHERIGENMTTIRVTPGSTARAAFVLRIDVQ